MATWPIMGVKWPNNMEAERRKRKLEEENEETKLEEFFALIRSTREMGDRLRSNSNGSKEKDQDTKKKTINNGVWNPTFRLEDFLEDHKTTPIATLIDQVGSSNQKEEDDHKEEEKKGDTRLDLDLNLSL